MKYKLINFFIRGFFPTIAAKKTLQNLCKKMEIREDIIKTQKNYPRIVKRLKKKAKIKVVFIVSENTKWGYQQLYELFDKSERFEPIVLITLLTSVFSGKDKTRYNVEENYNFFKDRGMNVAYLFKNGKYLDLKSFHPDIVFWDQPWDLPKKYTPRKVSKYALTCYSSYCFGATDLKERYIEHFDGFLYKYFIEHELSINVCKKYSEFAEKNCEVVGYPKLDAYTKELKGIPGVWRDPEKIKVIYAPHHSFDKKTKMATFDENGEFILELAKKHPETTWIFKPHPRFKFALLKTGLMTEEEIDNYYKEWEEVGTVYTKGDYIDIFKSSDAMITDCMSFLAEYLPSKHPLIRIVSPTSPKYNPLGELILSEYYNVYDNEALEKTFLDVVINKNDTRKEKRLDLIKEILDYNYLASEKIYDCIVQAL